MNILVSGGSRGLGLALCEHLLANGNQVASYARTTTPEVERLRTQFPETYLFTSADATDTDAIAALVSDVDAKWHGIDALVNNAAVGQDSLLAHTSPEAIAQLIGVNVTAPISLTRLVVRSMLKQPKVGRVVFISSIGANQGYPGLSVYSATKGALESFARSLSSELKGRVMVNVVAPGFFESEMSSVLLPEQLASIVRRTPSGVLTTPIQVVNVIDFVLNTDTNLNGTVIKVDGGASS